MWDERVERVQGDNWEGKKEIGRYGKPNILTDGQIRKIARKNEENETEKEVGGLI